MATTSGKEPGAVEQSVKRGLDLGWLVGSSVQPAKRREIDGVGTASIMGLQAQLYQAQEGMRLQRETGAGGEEAGPRRAGLHVKDADDAGNAKHQGAAEPRNAGVDARNQRDMQHVKTASQRISETYAALERKAALYEKLARGEQDDAEDKFEVDFLTKSAQPQQRAGAVSWEEDVHRGALPPPPGRGGDSDDDSDGGPRRRADPQQTAEEIAEAERKRLHKEVIMQLADQTRQQRERAAEARRAKDEQTQSKVEKLKADFLKRQLSKVRAAGGGRAGNTTQSAVSRNAPDPRGGGAAG